MDPRQARVLNKQLVTLDGTSWHKAHMLLDFMFNFTALESRNLQLVLINYELCRSKVRPDDVNDFISITNVNPLVKANYDRSKTYFVGSKFNNRANICRIGVELLWIAYQIIHDVDQSGIYSQHFAQLNVLEVLQHM